jgi:DNA ligase-associated metallophosphoesterase
MPTTYDLVLDGVAVVATAQRALWWPGQRTLFLADLHAGKVGHFRRHGLAVPGDFMAIDLDRLDGLITKYQAQIVVVLGDLFHSESNSEWDSLSAWVRSRVDVRFELVRGNHDRFLSDETLSAGGWHVYHESVVRGPFILSHAPFEDKDSRLAEYFGLSGHLHPAVRVHGRGRDSIRRPCYWIQKRQLVLPAFGAFTGALTIKPELGEQALVVGEHSIIGINY